VEHIIWSATPTPFRSDGALDVAALERLVEQHLGLGVTGLFLAGTCGEGPLMPNEQRMELVQHLRRLAAERLHLAVQVSDTSAARVRENLVQAQEAGADSVVIAPPWISYFCNRDFVRRYFFEPLDAAEVPVGIYVLATEPESGLDLDMWREIVAHPAVRYVKDSSASAEYLAALVEIKAQRPDLRVLTGYEFDVVTAVAAGYEGALLGTGILIGGMIRRALESLAAGDRATADSWQARSNAFLNELFRPDLSLWLGGLKYALVREGVFSTEFMHLSYPLTPADRAHIDAALDREGELIRGEPHAAL
jgi:4-hydroxy-tetrahydrodipicolinate synthase